MNIVIVALLTIVMITVGILGTTVAIDTYISTGWNDLSGNEQIIFVCVITIIWIFIALVISLFIYVYTEYS